MWQCVRREKTQLSKLKSYKQVTWSWESLSEHLQVKLLFPYRVQIPKDCFCPLLRFTHLNSYIRITGPRLVFGLQTLSTHHWKENRRVTTTLQQDHVSEHHLKYQLIMPRETGTSLMTAFLMSCSSWCTTVPAMGISAPATCMCTQQKDTEVREVLPLCYNSTLTLLLEAPKWDQETPDYPTHQWSWSLLTILRYHPAHSVSLSSSAEHVSFCSHKIHLWSSRRSQVCSAPGFSCDPSWPWWNSGSDLQLHASSSSLLLLCTRKYTMPIRNKHTQNHVSLNLDGGIKATSYPSHDGSWYWHLHSVSPRSNMHRDLGPSGGRGSSSSIIWDQIALLTTG